MQSPLKGSQLQSGWTDSYKYQNQDGPKTVERKRRGRGVDIISSSLPTPPSQSSSHLPTPETVRRSARPRKPLPPSTTQLPTPQTQRTKRRLSPSVILEEEHEEDEGVIPSPSGHTTFFLSNQTNASSSCSRPEKIRRRPGLTFAQQMGLLNTGKGVGMGGGHKSGIHVHGKVDQIGGVEKEKEKGSFVNQEENPFLVSGSGLGLGAPIPIPSPGQITIHRPYGPGGDEEGFNSDTEGQPSLASRRSPRLASPIPSSKTHPTLAQSISPTGLLSPPPTRHAPRIASSSSSKAKGITRQENVRRKKEMEMLDYESNPFLIKPGEPSTRIPKTKGPIVDEDLPTVTYVFRGSKKVFANPLYPSNTVFPRSELDPEDEEFEPNPLPKPKLLWPTGPSSLPSSSKMRNQRDRERTPSRSPPSSPVSTPTRSTRFGNSNLSLSVGPKGKVQDEREGIYSDDEGDMMMRDIRTEEHADADNHGQAELQDELPSRRGLLFGGGIGGSTNKGVKRRDVDEGDLGGRGKKARGILRL
ncbi:hypothetical protein V865_002307 [Kwoniella europaea PYCC6329]|uniref:Uncharacterized protein n=1 Tax=Kwoniella europaea PYCC6329 TaxID=1423913 RepID=A0AAX4KDW2_9TREE